MKQHTIISLLSIALLVVGCTTINATTQSIQGSGTIVTVERVVGDFTSIQVNMGADLILTQGNSESLRIEADDNLIEHIKTDFRNGRLLITTPQNINLEPSAVIRVHVTFDALREIEILGRSNITGENLNLRALTLNFSGSGSTRLSGTVDEQTIIIRGLATINNADLASRDVTIDISGNGIISVNGEDNLNIIVAGSGDIHYTGNPVITRNISGTANIVRQTE